MTYDNKYLQIDFPFDRDCIALVKTVPGYNFSKKYGWRVPLTLTSGRRLREAFGGLMTLSPAVIQWGREQQRHEKLMREIGVAKDVTLDNVPEDLNNWMHEYQRVGADFMSRTSCINADDPGTGKTIQTLAAIIQSGLLDGPHLIIAPKSTLKTVWKAHIERWIPTATVYAISSDSRIEEKRGLPKTWAKGEGPFFLITTPGKLRSKASMPVKVEEWNTVTFDEYHKMGLANPKTQLAQAARRLRTDRRWALSGTPMGGKPLRVWGALNWLDPVTFGNKWTWVKQWLQVTEHRFGTDIGGILPHREEEFYQALSPYMIRRRKSEIATELPPKVEVDVLCDMTPRQALQYRQMQQESMIKVQDEAYTAFNILAQYTALKQFANARQDILEGGSIYPTNDSGKLPALLERLEEREGEQFIVGSMSKKFTKLTAVYLEEHGFSVCLLTGDTGQEERERIVADFQAGEYDVICLTTTAGGVGLTLDAADSVHILDQSWDPDDQSQLSDRAHRISRIHNVTVYKYLSAQSIDEYVDEIASAKDAASLRALDLFRK